MLAARGARPEPDHAALAAVVAALPGSDPTATIFAGVRRLGSGETSALSASDSPAWRPRSVQPELEDLEGTDDALAEALWQAARSSVARAAEGVRVLGVLSGGGLDSSGLLAAAVAHARERGDLRIVPVAVDFAGPGDDRPHLRAAATWLGVDPLRISPEAAAPHLMASLLVDSRPAMEASLPLVIAAATEAKRHGAETIVTGFLGDLILAAPPYATAARIRLGGPAEAVRAVWAAAHHRDSFATALLSRLRGDVVAPLLRPFLPSWVLARRRRRALVTTLPWGGPRLPELVARPALRATASLPSTAAERFAALAYHVQMAEQVDTRAQVELLADVRLSEPWMDAEFCRTVARIPPWRLSAGNRERGLFRHALRGRLPDSVRLRPDKAMIEPALDRMLVAAGATNAFGGLLEARRLAGIGLVNRAALEVVVKRFFARRPGEDAGDSWTTLWSVASAEALLRDAERR